MTPQRSYTDYLQDILTAATNAMQFIAGVDRDAFRQDVEKVYAVTRALEIIGEAARQMPASAQAAYPQLPWQDMIGMRNVVVHGYFGVDPDVLWRTVHGDLLPLAAAVRAILDTRQGG